MKHTETGIRRVNRRVLSLEEANIAMSLPEFIDLLDISQQHPEYDLRLIQRSDLWTESSDPSYVLGLLEGDAFRQWHTEKNSKPLFVEGTLSTLSSRRASPLSLLCSQLIKLQEHDPQATVLYFFCGHHTATTDSLAGPSGMLRSLIRQVLRAYPDLKLNFLSPKLRSQLTTMSPDVRSLCTCFRHLVNQINPSDQVFCIIDGICFFEKREWSEPCRKAVDELFEITQDEELYPIIKLFLTSPSRSRCIASIFPQDCRINMNGGNERTRPTEREIATANAKIARFNMRKSMRRMHDVQEVVTEESTFEPMPADDSEYSD